MDKLYFIILLLVGFMTIVFLAYGYTKDKPKKATIYHITFHNVSDNITYQLSTTNDEPKNLPPKYQLTYNLPYGKIITIKTFHPDGTIKITRHLVKVDEVINLTNVQLVSETQGTNNVQFYNNSNFPIIIVEKTASGSKRWGSDIIPPNTQFQIAFVENDTSWEVVHPTSEDYPISRVTISGVVKKIEFDGDNIVAL